MGPNGRDRVGGRISKGKGERREIGVRTFPLVQPPGDRGIGEGVDFQKPRNGGPALAGMPPRRRARQPPRAAAPDMAAWIPTKRTTGKGMASKSSPLTSV